MSEVIEKFSYEQGAGYEADEFYVYKHPKYPRKYAVNIDGGCSCYVYERPTVEQLSAMEPMGKREVYAAFMNWWDADFSGDTKLGVLERLRAAL